MLLSEMHGFILRIENKKEFRTKGRVIPIYTAGVWEVFRYIYLMKYGVMLPS